jgi:hypothetical protein
VLEGDGKDFKETTESQKMTFIKINGKNYLRKKGVKDELNQT